jgi:transposase
VGIAKNLEGTWRQDLLFVLHQEVEMYDVYQQRIAECDQQLQKHLTSFADTVPSPAKEGEPKKKKAKANKNTPQFHLSGELHRSGSHTHRRHRCDGCPDAGK